MISHTHRCIFVHVPRTGGSSVEDVIWPGNRSPSDLWMGFVSPYRNAYQTGGLQHLCASQIRQEVGTKTFEAYFKFSFVRNPWDKAVSQYAYMRRRPDLRSFIGMEECDSFKRYLDLIAKHTHVQWQPQHEFLFDDRGEPLVDFIGRFERFEEDVLTVFSRLGIQAPLPRTNASVREPLRAYYDQESIQRVGEMYERDIEMFGYAYQNE